MPGPRIEPVVCPEGEMQAEMRERPSGLFEEVVTDILLGICLSKMPEPWQPNVGYSLKADLLPRSGELAVRPGTDSYGAT
jgi:hypothetical protein